VALEDLESRCGLFDGGGQQLSPDSYAPASIGWQGGVGDGASTDGTRS
jgi:hypothetical protein